MKKILVVIFTMILAISLIGCGVKKKFQEKIGEAITEKIFEEAVGVDVDISGEEITFTTEEGESILFGKTEWPTSDLAKTIPKIDKGTVTSVMETEDYIGISLEGTPEDEFVDFLNKIKKTFTKDSYEVKSDGYVSYGGGNGDGVTVSVIYDSDETLSISIVKVVE